MSLSQRVYETLDWLCRFLNDPANKLIDQEKLNDLKELFGQVSISMSFEEMLNMQYSNRLYYIQKLLYKKNGKIKSWIALGGMIDEEIERIEKMCEKYFQNIEEFT